MSISIGIPRMNAAQHVTVKKRGQKLYPHRWHADANLFTCPFCSSDACKPRPYHLIMAHLAGHRIRMLEYGDLVIYTCKLGCGMQAKHFHCCYCPKRYVNRNELMKHLNSTHPIIKTQAPSIPIQPGKKDASEELPSTIGCSSKYWLLLPAPPMMHRNGIYSQFQPKKVAGPPRKLLAPPEENQEDGRPYQGHITVKKKDQKLFPNRWPADPALFTCPFCSLDACKPRPYHLIMTHLAGHKLRVLEYADQVIYTCKLDCGKKPKHHHCCSCPKSFGNPRELMKHLLSDHPISTCAQETQDQPLPQNPAKEGLSPAESSQEDRSLQLAGPLGTQEGAVKVPFPPITVKKKHQKLFPQRCHGDDGLFTCPFCSNVDFTPRGYHLIMSHLASHKLKAVMHGDHVMYTCRLGCGQKYPHFHCCQCPKIYRHKNQLRKHLDMFHPITPCSPNSEASERMEPEPEQSTHPCSPNSICSATNPPTVEPIMESPAPSALENHTSVEKQAGVTAKKVLVVCPHCDLILNSRNLKIHIERRHPATLDSVELHVHKAPEPEQSPPHSINSTSPPSSPLLQPTMEFPALIQHELHNVSMTGVENKEGKKAKTPDVMCPHCNLCLKSKNLKKHIERKHQTVLHSVSTLNEPEPSSPSGCPCAISPVSNPDLEVTIESPVPNPMEKHKADAKKRAPVMCPHCNLCLRSNNLKKHIERKHQTPTDPVSTVLSAQCVDKANGIYVVGKAIGDNSPPIHVAKKFWGSTHRIMCELDVCNSRVEKAQKNELLARQCLHLNAVDFCQEVAPNEELSEVVLNYLVDHKGVDPSMKSQCLEQQNKAKSEGVTLASVVTLNECSNTYFISVFEPEVSHFCKMGRVLVCYDANDKKWACPCKVRKSCLHKNIAQWCLFQMKRELFITKDQQEVELRVETAGEDLDLSNILW